MKRIFCLFFGLLMLFSSASLAESGYVNIREMKEQIPQRWMKTYATQWRDIAIDAEIIVPEVETLPIVLLKGGATKPLLTAEEAGWDRMEYHGAYDLRLVNEIPDYPRSVDGVRIGMPVSRESWYSGFAPENRYVPLDDISFGEITARVKEKITRLGYDPDAFEFDHPVRLWTHHVYGVGTEKDLLPGYLYMEVRPRVAGIPVMSHILQAVTPTQGRNRQNEFMLLPNSNIGYNGYLGDLSNVLLHPLEICETLADDIPLCSFDKVLSTIETEIEAGHIRKIYEIELGYVLYNEPGVYRTQSSQGSKRESEAYLAHQNARYYAKPTWQINCLYVENAQGRLHDEFADVNDERNSLQYKQLVIDAQTGEPARRTNERERGEYKGFIAWDE